MEVSRHTSRTIGVLILLQMVGGVLANFVLSAPLFGSPGFLINAAPHSAQIALSALLGLAIGAMSVGIAISAYPVFRQHSQAMALWFVALSAVSLSAVVVENINVMSMLSLSEAYAKASAPERELFQTMKIVVAAARNWAHFVGLVVAGCMLLVLYATLYRYALVPRILAAVGLAAVLLQLVVVARPLFGYEILFPLLAPLGVTQLILAFWLIIKGFQSPL